MKGLLAIFTGVYAIFGITAAITHVWTVIIAYQESGFFAALLSLFLPFLSELYWMFKMFGDNNTYAFIALAHLVLAFVFSSVGGNRR